MKKWEPKLDNLQGKFLITSKNCPIPHERDVILWAWEVMKPVVKRFIEDNFVPKKKE